MERREKEPLSSEVVTAFRRDLLQWFQAARRRLPWRKRRTPYRVWVAEVMLQQTRVQQVQPYYERFLRRFPTLRSLAKSRLQDVLRVWAGLGYYARARNLHRAARVILRKYGGRLPRTAGELVKLPGIGEYTAAAIASLAFGEPCLVLDGNVARVLTRVGADDVDPRSAHGRRALLVRARDLCPPGQEALFNEALMELGATVCAPRKPRCEICPLARVCRARQQGRQEDFPRKRRRPARPHKVVGAAVIVRSDGRILIAQRRETSMLGGLWEFPGGGLESGESMQECIARELREELGVRVRVGPEFMVVRHAYSHFTIALHVHWAKIVAGRPRAVHCANFAWVRLNELDRYPFARADEKVVQMLQSPSGQAQMSRFLRNQRGEGIRDSASSARKAAPRANR